jgi:chromosome segregation ATPase
MHRSTALIVTVLVSFAVPALTQTASTDSQTLQAILAELRQLHHDLQTSGAMAARAQIALYRLQQQNEVVARAMQRVGDARSRVTQLEDARHHKTQDIEQDREAVNRSNSSNAQPEFDQVVLPRLKSELELLQRQEHQARAEQAEAEQQLRDEQVKLDGLNDLLDRYNNALQEVGRK